MIVVDDGSEDRTGQIVESFRDPRITYLRQEHRGIWRLGEAYNAALSVATGDLVAILEGDDFWDSRKLEKQIKVFEDPSITFSYARAEVVDQSGGTLWAYPHEGWTPPLEALNSISHLPFLRELLLVNSAVQPVTAIIRRDKLEQVGGFYQPSYFPAVDYPTFLRLAQVGRVSYVDAVLGFWRIHSGQVTRALPVRVTEGALKAALEFFDGLDETVKAELRINRDDIVLSRRQLLADGHWSVGLDSVTQGEWGAARQAFKRTLVLGTAFRRTEALLGLLAGWLHLDVASLIRRLGDSRWGQSVVNRRRVTSRRR